MWAHLEKALSAPGVSEAPCGRFFRPLPCGRRTQRLPWRVHVVSTGAKMMHRQGRTAVRRAVLRAVAFTSAGKERSAPCTHGRYRGVLVVRGYPTLRARCSKEAKGVWSDTFSHVRFQR